jgi:hypothetical protein
MAFNPAFLAEQTGCEEVKSPDLVSPLTRAQKGGIITLLLTWSRLPTRVLGSQTPGKGVFSSTYLSGRKFLTFASKGSQLGQLPMVGVFPVLLTNWLWDTRWMQTEARSL